MEEIFNIIFVGICVILGIMLLPSKKKEENKSEKKNTTIDDSTDVSTTVKSKYNGRFKNILDKHRKRKSTNVDEWRCRKFSNRLGKRNE